MRIKTVWEETKERYRMPYTKHGKLCLVLSKGETLVPGAPSEWAAPNGVRVAGNATGWNGSFHESAMWSELVVLVADHRRFGASRRALTAYWEQFKGKTVNQVRLVIS